MEDVAPQLAENVTGEFRRLYDASGKIKGLLAKVKAKTATYAEAQEYAIEVSRLIGQAWAKCVTPDTLPEGRMYYNIAARLVPAALDENHELVAGYAAEVQKGLNDRAGIGLKVQRAEQDRDRVKGLVELACSTEQYEDTESRLLSAFENFSQHIVDETIRRNAELHHNAGLSPKIIRRSTGKCCRWCQALAGTYDYPDVDRDVYRRHDNCRCTVLYDPADGSKSVQNVHTRRWTNEKDYAKLEAGGMAKPGWVESDYNEKQRTKQGFEAFPTGDVLKTYIQRVKPEGDFFDVAMHGTQTAVCFGTDRVSMDARELARIILRDPNYRKGQSVRLLSCSTGQQTDDGSYCVAEQIANILGVEVKAPNDTLNFRPNGDLYVGYWGTGEFVTFTPNQRRRRK